MVGLVLVLFLSWGLVDSDSGKPAVISSPERIRAKVGDDVVLQCHLKPPLDVTNMFVEWRHNGKILHIYQNRKDDPELQDERFRGRTSLFHHEMTRGNISLKLNGVTEEDSGEFSCFVYGMGKGFVTLNVVKPQLICSQQPITALVGDDVILPCHLEPPVSAADWTVEWSKPGLDPESVHYHEDGRLKNKEQNPSFSYRTRLFVNDMKTGNVSMKISRVEESDAGIYKCFLPSIKKEASIKLIVGKATKGCDISVIIIVCSSLIMVVVAGHAAAILYVWRKKTRTKAKVRANARTMTRTMVEIGKEYFTRDEVNQYVDRILDTVLES